MHVYQTYDDIVEGPFVLHETQAQAQQHLKANVPAVFRGGARMYLLSVPTDKASLVQLLNTPEELENISYRIGAWRMTARGGLRRDPTE